MKTVLRMLPVVIICSFILIIFSEKSYACDCINVSAEEAFQKNDVVFEGKVIEVGRKEGVVIEVLFEVKKIWKGTNSSQIIVYTNGGDCVFHFVEGGEYLVYSSQRGSEKQLHTNSCSRTKRLDEAGADKVALSQFAKESVPTKEVDLKGEMVSGFSRWQVAIISIGLLLIIVFIVRKTRKK
ncbi:MULTISPECIES: cobalamin biosynthesis protein CbiN [Bacillus cereus group]|uniref:cobalamin biosynthesis protein CbiN n=1 Tax=Bacillus cereus group TaxID=86661 RepID=UPI001298AB8D|nr:MULTISPECIES: cobalamin biosynthesis protein CbiN [Bacillus cereus group]MCR6788175.1 cobalamin biosynthesis protein CbiN [Bacillus thuringiensis]MCR6822139.1 cobalamin biosynthesis protein CbiN [Bacillus thuringiensis]MCR6830251.1 cobalamin biosynthesis protein CbiN [Bacillus thuringiensis]MEB8929267.1 cobalamin biosynthesis protein CbiN [Bacillus cereus]MEB9323372.1 cobalamin biosynthesis protein CbiN [Bacillus cereus]